MTLATSPFLTPPLQSQSNTLALLSLKRDQTIPIVLKASGSSTDEDIIANTRFGAYPHSTLLYLPWGVQVVASNVGAHERKRGKKRKRTHDDSHSGHKPEPTIESECEPAFEAAASGFAHLLPPTPEQWTVSLPHRTQVVYTPDYSYILQRLRVGPGDRLIEAGAGSGSFTHAAVRAVFNGYPGQSEQSQLFGKIFSFEYHEPRYKTLVKEVNEHGLESLVRMTCRDVYQLGFVLNDEPGGQNVTGVFLDLPAPWLAISNLTRNDGPLHPDREITLCSFSPCIEQAQKTVSKLRELGWVDVGMAEMRHQRLDVRRDRVGLQEEGLRGVNANPASVDEALGRLRELESKQTEYHAHRQNLKHKNSPKSNGSHVVGIVDTTANKPNHLVERPQLKSRQQRLQNNLNTVGNRKLFKEGRLIHRTEPELKTHTSYLVFALLPLHWTAEHEAACQALYAN